LRHSDALQPGGHPRRPTTGSGCNHILEPRHVPLHERSEAPDQSDARADEKKESTRWLQNLRQSTELLNDPERCVHIGDRESDIYELFCLAQHLGTHFLVRTCVDRLAGDGEHTVRDEMKQPPVRELYRVQVRDKRGELSTAVLEIRCRRIVVRPPIGKQKDYPELILSAIHASERETPKSREKTDWKLPTDLPVRTRQEAAEKLSCYAQRWKIETFDKIL
jgi:hypothetical protein